MLTEGEHWRLIKGDVLTTLPTLPAASFDAIVTDPPYGQTNEHYDSDIASRPEIWRECYRICARDAALVSFAGSRTYHRIASAIEAGGWLVRQMWGWVYRDGMITSAYPVEGFDRLAPAMDPICYATKGKVLLHLEREGDSSWARNRRTSRSLVGISERSGGRPAPAGVGRYPRSLVSDGTPPFNYFALPRAGQYATTDHPNEKPLSLLEWLIGKLPGRRLLDPFCGSGTTLLAALAMGWEAVGIDIAPDFCFMARR